MREHLTEDERAIEARVEAATPGPWREYGNGGTAWSEIRAGGVGAGFEVVCDTAGVSDADAALIANAPADLAALLDRLSACRAGALEAYGRGASDYAASLVRRLLAAGLPKVAGAHGAIEEAGAMVDEAIRALELARGELAALRAPTRSVEMVPAGAEVWPSPVLDMRQTIQAGLAADAAPVVAP